VPCRNRGGVFAGEDGADGLQVDGAAGGDSECRGKLGFGCAGGGHGPRQLGGKLVGKFPGPGLQRARGRHRLPPRDHVCLQAVRCLARLGSGHQGVTERADRRRPGWALPDGPGQLAGYLGIAVEEQVFLAREVSEDRWPGHVGGLGDLRNGYLVEPAVQEQRRCHIRDALAHLRLLACPAPGVRVAVTAFTSHTLTIPGKKTYSV
jgi:hypothetical protein